MIHPYVSERYTAALAGDRPSLRLAGLDTTSILRPIPGSALVDAAGPYPFTPLTNSRLIAEDFSALSAAGAVSLTFVIDALQPDTDWFRGCFDYVQPFKRHCLVDHRVGTPSTSPHHQYEVRRALVNKCETQAFALMDHLNEWTELYDNLLRRHELTGIHAFSQSYFQQIAQMPELLCMGAFRCGAMLSCHLWMTHGNFAYSHLSASSEEGYSCGASYVVCQHSIDMLSGCDVIDLGGVPGVSDSTREGLARFKRGFTNAESQNWICGKILRQDVYDKLCTERNVEATSESYFPAYRMPGH